MTITYKSLILSMLCLITLREPPPVFCNPESIKVMAESPDSIGGVWLGHLTSDGTSHDIKADFKQIKDKIDGTISCTGKEGTSKHYLKGLYLSNNAEFSLHDVGVDLEQSSSSLRVESIESYSLHLVENGKKIVGAGQQANKKLWIVLERPSAETNQNPSHEKPKNQAEQNSPEKLFQKDPSRPSQEKGKITPEVVAYMTYVERTLKSHWHPSRSSKSRQVMTLFKIHEDGTVSDIQIDNQKEAPMLDDQSEAALDAIKLSAPFQPLTKSIEHDVNDSVLDIKFSFSYNAPRHRTSVPMLLFGRGAIVFPTSSGQ